MTIHGVKEIEKAKEDGRWEAAYDSQKNMTMSEDFLLMLAQDKGAEVFFKTLNKANMYAIAWRLQTAKKPETRKKRMLSIIATLKQKKKFH